MKRIRKSICRLLVLCMLVTMLPMSVFAESSEIASGTCGDNLTWVLNSEGTLIISGTGAMPFYGANSSVPWDSCRSSVKTVIIENGVTTIGNFAFSNCGNLIDVTIADSITKIGGAAFADCGKLEEISIPNHVTEIGGSAFLGCVSLRSITIPSSVAHISDINGSAFADCSSLVGIWVDEGNAYYCNDENGVLFNKSQTELIAAPGTISGSYTIPEGVISIGLYAFGNCTNLTNINIPDSVTNIGNLAFGYCTGLTNITIPKSVTSIDAAAFCLCANLTSITIPAGVTSIGYQTFYACTSLADISIPKSVVDIEDHAFYDCTSLTDVYYAGPEDGWSRISIGINNTDLTNATIHYSSELDATDKENSGAKEFNGHWYKLITEEMNWIEADEYCRSIGGHLVTITSEGENSFVQSLISESTMIGLSDASEEGVWTWVTGEDVTYTNWAKNEPNNEANEDYALMRADGTWNDGHLQKENRVFICEWESVTDIEIPDPEGPQCAHTWDSGTETKNQTCTECGEITFTCTLCGETKTMDLLPLGHDYVTGICSQCGDTSDIASPDDDLFSIQTSGWSFINAAYSFTDQYNDANDYYIPKSRYDSVYGEAYGDAKFKEKNMTWNGNCSGMSATAILFHSDILDWQLIDDLYANDFTTPNSYFHSVKNINERYYVTAGSSNEITRLIEEYQLFVNEAIVATCEDEMDEVFNTFLFKAQENNYEIRSQENGGTYIKDVLSKFQEACENNEPLFINLQANGYGHAIVSRTDRAPENQGNGWWNVYVYDPNKPYVNNGLMAAIQYEDPDAEFIGSCNSLITKGNDVFIELNPELNLWRYCTSANGSSPSDYIGCDTSGQVKYKVNSSAGLSLPEFFYIVPIDDILPTGNYSNPKLALSSWLPDETSDTIKINVDDTTNCLIYNGNNELVAIVEDGNCGVIIDNGYALRNIGATCGSSETILLPNQEYHVDYSSGVLKVYGNNNLISVFSESSASIIIDVENNSIDVKVADSGSIDIKCANIFSANVCSYVEGRGNMLSGQTLLLSFDDSNTIKACTDNLGIVELEYKEPEDTDAEYCDTVDAHSYSAPTFIWSKDYSACVVSLACNNCSNNQIIDCVISKVVTPATETAAGKTVYTATVVFEGQTYTETKTVVIPATGHVNHITTLVPAVDATCEQTGNTAYYTCLGCDDWFLDASGTVVIADKTSVVTVMLGHSFTNYVSNSNASCTVDGTKTAKCDRCNATDTVTDVGSSKGHKYETTWSKDEDGHWHNCSCGDKTEEVPHTYNEWITTKKADAGVEGSKERTCSVCGYKQTEKLPATTTPATGDNTQIGVLFAMMLISACGMITLLSISLRKKGKCQRNNR